MARRFASKRGRKGTLLKKNEIERMKKRVGSPFLSVYEEVVGKEVLEMLKRENRISQVDLSDRLNLPRGTIQRALKMLISPLTKEEKEVAKRIREIGKLPTDEEIARKLGLNVKAAQAVARRIMIKTGEKIADIKFEKDTSRFGIREKRKKWVRPGTIEEKIETLPKKFILESGNVVDLRNFARILKNHPSDLPLLSLSNRDLSRIMSRKVFRDILKEKKRVGERVQRILERYKKREG